MCSAVSLRHSNIEKSNKYTYSLFTLSLYIFVVPYKFRPVMGHNHIFTRGTCDIFMSPHKMRLVRIQKYTFKIQAT